MPPNGSGSTPASMSRTIDSLKTLRIFVTRSSADLSTYATMRRRSQDFSVPFLDCDVELFMRSYICTVGKRHHAALRALAFKWQRILFRCWKDGVAYDESKYIASLKKRNSPLSAWLPE